jgi:hypothetical protein
MCSGSGPCLAAVRATEEALDFKLEGMKREKFITKRLLPIHRQSRITVFRNQNLIY